MLIWCDSNKTTLFMSRNFCWWFFLSFFRSLSLGVKTTTTTWNCRRQKKYSQKWALRINGGEKSTAANKTEKHEYCLQSTTVSECVCVWVGDGVRITSPLSNRRQLWDFYALSSPLFMAIFHWHFMFLQNIFFFFIISFSTMRILFPFRWALCNTSINKQRGAGKSRRERESVCVCIFIRFKYANAISSQRKPTNVTWTEEKKKTWTWTAADAIAARILFL